MQTARGRALGRLRADRRSSRSRRGSNDNLIIASARKQSVIYVVQLNGANLTLAILILAVMITPIMVALIAGALAAVPRSWKEGSAALGVNRWRTIVRVSLRTARPAIVGRDRARHRARARRGDHARDGRRLRAASPPTRSTGSPSCSSRSAAGGDDRPGSRGADDRPAGHTLYAMARRAARLGGAAVVRRLGRQAAA